MEQLTDYTRYKTIFMLLTAVVFIWGAIGTLDITHIPYAGYNLSPDNVVTQAREGSPVATAGLKVGDTVTRVDGIAIEDFAGFANQTRRAINSEGSITVTRGDAEQTITFRYAQQPAVDIIAGFGAVTLTGLAFLILGLMTYLKNPSRLSTTFCVLGLLFASVLFNSAYLTSSIQRRIINGGLSIVVAILIAVILDYCLSFPRTKRLIGEHQWLRQAIYIIALAYGVMMATVNITTPVISARRAMMLSTAAALYFGGYLLLSIIAVAHSYIKASAQERSATGINLMLLGMVIGFGPLVITIVARAINPHLGELPGERFYLITFLAIPIGLAMALMRLEPAAIRRQQQATT